MSRTLKDKPSKLRFDFYTKDQIELDHYGYSRYRLGKTTKTKKRKELDTEDHWMSTPSWWTRLMMGKPERRNAHMLEKKILRIVDLEDFDFPNLKRKPHIYFW